MDDFAGFVSVQGSGIDLAECEAKLLNRYDSRVARHAEGVRGRNFVLAGGSPRAVLRSRGVVTRVGELVSVTVAGRIDNATALKADLGLCGQPSIHELLAECYRKWGEGAVSRIRGDFSLCILDVQAETVLLARDPIGMHPLFYYSTDEALVWATDLSLLIEMTRPTLCLDDEYVAAFVCELEPIELTPYKSINRIRPGHTYSFRSGKLVRRRYWDIGRLKSVRLSSDEDYEYEFFRLFQQSVSRRLTPSGLHGAELSGGMDSSSIVCMADHVSSQEGMRRVDTVSMVFDRSRYANEKDYISIVEKARGQTGLHLLESQHPLCDFRFDEVPPLPNLKHVMQLFYRSYARYFKERNVVSLLSGLGGDQVLWSSDWFLPAAHVQSSGGLRKSIGSMKYSIHRRRIKYWRIVWEGVCLPRAPSRFREWMRLRSRPHAPFLRPAAIRPILARTLANVTDATSRDLDFITLHRIIALAEAVGLAASCRHRDFLSIPVSFPYLDVDLLEFLLAIPVEQLYRPAQSRSVQRRALRSLLPVEVCGREAKIQGGLGEAYCQAIANCWSELGRAVVDSQIMFSGAIDRELLTRGVERVTAGDISYSSDFLSVVTMAVWLKAQSASHTRTN